jgi:hypothetical protein
MKLIGGIILIIVVISAIKGGSHSNGSPAKTTAEATADSNTPWGELQTCLNDHPLFAGHVEVHGHEGQPSEPGASLGHIIVFDEIHGAVANITEYASHTRAVANAKAGNEAQPAAPAEDGLAAEPATPAETPADSGNYVWTEGPLTYFFDGRPISDDSSHAVLRCIQVAYGP